MIVIVVFASCDRAIELSPGLEDFDVRTEKTEYEVNEEVIFHFDGNPDMISFYSGELYNDYAYKEARLIELEKTLMSFSSARPVLTNSQESDFKVLVSTNFNNIYNYENVTAANWTDITSEFTYGTTVTYVPSGDYEVSELYEEGKPLYVAFRYNSKPQETYGPVRRFLIQGFQMLGQSMYGNHILGDPMSSDFRLIEKSEEAKTTSALTTTYISFNGYTRTLPTDPDPETDTWAITKVFDLDKLDKGPDRAVALKGNQDPEIRSHIHAFQEAGEYTVTFVATNANIDGSKQVVKQIKITVVDPD